MTLFLWKKSYEIGVAEIDMQHRQLVGFINELSEAMMVKQGHRTVPHVIEELGAYILLHFTTEEALMEKSFYPGRADHHNKHLELTGKFLAFKDRYFQDQKLNPKELLDFMCNWLKDHIMMCDKEFGVYLRRAEMGYGDLLGRAKNNSPES